MTEPAEVVPNLIFFNFDVFAFHNMGQMNISWREKFPDSLACNPDTRFAALDSLQTIVTEFQGDTDQQQPENILLFKSDKNSFEKLLNFIKLNAKSAHEYTDHLREFLSQYLMLKDTDPEKVQKICKFVIDGLLECKSYQEYFQGIKTHLPQGLDNAQKQEEFFKVLLALLRSIPQPWNALAAGLTFQKILGLKPEGIECHPKYPAYKIQNVLDIDDSDNTPKEYKDFVKQIQLYLEYVLVRNTPQDWTPGNAPAKKKDLSAVLLPLIDNGFFRGLLVFVPPEAQPFWDNHDLIRYHCEQCLTLTQSIRHAFETTLLNTLIQRVKTSQEDRKDLHETFLVNVSKIQEIALGSLWDVKGTAKLLSVTGYGRRFREDKGKTEPGIFCYRNYQDYKEFYKIKANTEVLEQALYAKEEDIIKGMLDLYKKDAYSFFSQYPKIEEMFDNSHDYPQANDHSFYKTKGLSIKWRMTLPVLQGDNFKAVYFLYYRDPLWMLHNAGSQKVVLLSTIVKGEKKEEARNQIFSARARQIMKFFSTIDAHKKSNLEIQRHSTKAAVSAIISRNHSHHIGSHVTPRTSSEQIKERLEALAENAYYVIPSNHLTVIGLLKDRLDRYIQKKAEFTAEVATDPLLSTKSERLFNDVLLGFIENTLLMDNIGANEEVRYTKSGDSGIRIHFFFDGNEIVAQYGDRDNPKDKTRYTSLNYPYIGCEANTEIEIQHLARQRIVKFGTQEDGKGFDPKVALPGPVGEYAIYSFLENFIRNTIKHNRETLQSSAAANNHLDVYLRIKDLDDEFYTLEIWDKVTELEKKAALEKYVKRSVVKDDGDLKKGGWGIAEMKIMATLLKGSDDFLDMSGNIEVVSIQFEDKECLGYSLRVMKAKDLAFISQRVPENRYDTLKKKGIWCFPSIKSFDEHINGRDMPFSSDFVAIDKPSADDISIEKIAAQAAKLPFRVLIHEKRDVEGVFPGCHLATENYFEDLEKLNTDHEAIIERTWKEWTGRFCGESNPNDVTVGLYLEQSLTESPAKEWKLLAKNMSKKVGSKPKNTALTLIYPANNKPNATHDCRSKVALYDRHGQGQVYFSNQDLKTDPVLFYEAFDKNSPDFAHLFSPPKSKITYYELIEAALLNILILDERVAEFADKSLTLKHSEYLFGTSGTSRLAVAKRAGIYICTHVQIDACDPVALHKSVEHVADPITAQISLSDESLSLSVLDASAHDKKISFDAVVIHQGIMDGILKDLIGRLLGEQTAFLDGLKKSIPYIVVDSGRGIPPQLSSETKFLPFSLLQDFLLGPLVAKIGLVKTIMPLTRRK